MAGDHAQTESHSWRHVASQVYRWCLAGSALALVFLLPPHFDLRLPTILAVLAVAAFLVAMERPMRTAAMTVAPLTAILAASGVLFGFWMIALAIVAVITVRWRISAQENVRAEILGSKTLAQSGIAVFSSYGVVETWRLFIHLNTLTPSFFHHAITLIGVVSVGLVSQGINNVLVGLHYTINGKPFVFSQIFRTGIVASIYAYLLVATYQFGGLVGTTIFYIVVAQIKVLQDVMGITSQLHKLERAQSQAIGLVKDMIHFTDAHHVEFASEVQNIAQMMGRHLGMAKKEIELLGLAAELHEIGKSHLPARVRNRIDLTPKEEAMRKTYSRWGGLMVRAADGLLPVQIADWIEFHGEHFDGSGYPRGLKGESIPLQSRVIAVARDYVKYLTGYDGAEPADKEKALALLREGSGTLYDPRLVNLLYELVS